MGHKVVGKLKHDDEVFDHGESVSAGDVGGEDNFNKLVAAKAIVTDEEFKSAFPEEKDGEVVDASGMPSNLREVEGTKLQANMPENANDPKTAPGRPDGDQARTNPADPPEVKGAGNAKAAEKDKKDSDSKS